MNAKEVRNLRSLRLVALAVLCLSLVVATLVPVYTDEIGWRLQMRAAIDGVDIMFNDLCGPTSLAHPMWFMWPARWFSATANMALANPLFVRAAGVACAVAWIALLCLITSRVQPDRVRRIRSQVIVLALAGLGLLPLVMVMSRPEQPVLLAITSIILIALLPLPARTARAWIWAKVAVILVLTAIAVSYHMKGVLYSVVAITCLAVCARGPGTVLPRAIGGVALLALVGSAAVYWVGRFRCPGDAAFAAQLARENIAAVAAAGGNTGDLLLQALKGANPLNYVALAIPTKMPMSNWIPPDMFPGHVTSIAGLFVLAGWLTAFALVASALLRHFKATGWRGLGEPQVLIAGAIVGCVLVWGASQLIKNVYEAAHTLPMLLMACVLTWSLPAAVPSRASRALPLAFVTGMLISQALVVGASAGPLWRASQTPAYPQGQPFSVSVSGYADVRRDIGRAMQASGMGAHRPLQRLLVDDLTYLALQEHRLPLHRLGVLSVWTGSITDPVAYLRSRGSDGVVVGCRYLSPEMRAAASRSGEICAISRAGLESIERGRSAGEPGGGADAA
ncbi:MAG: hypothetical protein ACO1OD_00895 [Croceibacterium sp.]